MEENVCLADIPLPLIKVLNKMIRKYDGKLIQARINEKWYWVQGMAFVRLVSVANPYRLYLVDLENGKSGEQRFGTESAKHIELSFLV